MRFLLFLILVLLAAPLGVFVFEMLDIFVRPDRLAPLFGLEARFDHHARLALTGLVPTLVMLGLWILLTRSRVRPVAQPQLFDQGREAHLIRAERDYWRDTVARLLAAQQVSEQDRDLLFETIRKTLDEHHDEGAAKPGGEGPKTGLIAER